MGLTLSVLNYDNEDKVGGLGLSQLDYGDGALMRRVGLSEERIHVQMPIVRKYLAFWREYPDLFIDFLQAGKDGEVPQAGLKLYFYQRVFLRCCCRYKYVFATFPRAFSKSFLNVLAQVVRCILFPRVHLSITAPGKAQAAEILKEKMEELINLIPALAHEIDRTTVGGTTITKDYVRYLFKNGSTLDNLAAGEKSRGKRRHGLTGEEVVGIDGEILSSVLLPVLNISRNAMDGSRHNEETVNKSQIYIKRIIIVSLFGNV